MKRPVLEIILLLLTVTAVFSSFLAAGCWDRREISGLAVVLGTGVDWTPQGKILLTVQVARPTAFVGGETGSGGKEATAASWTVSAEGRTIEEAESNLASSVPRQIYWGHSIVLVIGEEMAKRGTNKVTNFFQRNRQPRENMWVMVCKGEAREFLTSYSVLEKTSSQAAGFLSLLRAGHSVHLREFSEMLAKEGVEPSCALVEVRDEGSVPSQGQEKGPAAKKQAALAGAAVFKEDRLVGSLDLPETRSALWLKGEVFNDIVAAPSPQDPSKVLSYKMREGKVKLTPSYEGGRPLFYVTVEVEGDVLEQQGGEDLTDRETLAAVEESVSKEMEKRLAALIQKVLKEYRSDIFGFGEAFRRKHKREWRVLKNNWDEQLAQAGIYLEVEAKVRDFGLLTTRASTKKE